MEIADIKKHLESIAKADFVSEGARQARGEAALLLWMFRLTVINGKRWTDEEVVRRLREALATQGEG